MNKRVIKSVICPFLLLILSSCNTKISTENVHNIVNVKNPILHNNTIPNIHNKRKIFKKNHTSSDLLKEKDKIPGPSEFNAPVKQDHLQYPPPDTDNGTIEPPPL